MKRFLIIFSTVTLLTGFFGAPDVLAFSHHDMMDCEDGICQPMTPRECAEHCWKIIDEHLDDEAALPAQSAPSLKTPEIEITAPQADNDPISPGSFDYQNPRQILTTEKRE